MRATYLPSLASLAIILPLLFGSAGVKAQTRPRITGTYSNMYYNEKGGDVLGYELKIVYTGDRFQGALQIAEGVPGPLMLVDIQASGAKISFSIPEGTSHAGQFNGAIEKGVLKGAFHFKSGGSDKVELLRRKSYWD